MTSTGRCTRRMLAALSNFSQGSRRTWVNTRKAEGKGASTIRPATERVAARRIAAAHPRERPISRRTELSLCAPKVLVRCVYVFVERRFGGDALASPEAAIVVGEHSETGPSKLVQHGQVVAKVLGIPVAEEQCVTR